MTWPHTLSNGAHGPPGLCSAGVQPCCQQGCHLHTSGNSGPLRPREVPEQAAKALTVPVLALATVSRLRRPFLLLDCAAAAEVSRARGAALVREPGS